MRTRKDAAAAANATATKASASTPRAPRATRSTASANNSIARRRSSSSSAPMASSGEVAVADAGAQLPNAIRLPALATMGLAISTVLHVLATQFGDGD
ncbi:hypothetical protein O988_04900, partial [Pseudogymnoascus sp. VKM F-3808]